MFARFIPRIGSTTVWTRVRGRAALALATLDAARLFGFDDQLGSIEPGKVADLILVDGDPSQDIRDIRRVVTVIKDGRAYDPSAIYRALGVRP